jgi:hypothetical protein
MLQRQRIWPTYLSYLGINVDRPAARPVSRRRGCGIRETGQTLARAEFGGWRPKGPGWTAGVSAMPPCRHAIPSMPCHAMPCHDERRGHGVGSRIHGKPPSPDRTSNTVTSTQPPEPEPEPCPPASTRRIGTWIRHAVTLLSMRCLRGHGCHGCHGCQ